MLLSQVSVAMITSEEVVLIKTSIFFPVLRIRWQFIVTIRFFGRIYWWRFAVGFPSVEVVELSLHSIRLLVWLGVKQVSSVSYV